MSLDGRFLNALSKELEKELNTGRIQKVSQLSKTDFLFVIRAHNENKKLYISLSTSLARINLTSRKFSSDYTPGGFCMFLRKHIERATILNIKTLEHDRILEIEVTNSNDIGDTVRLYIILEIFSRYTNLIVLDEDRKIINAYKHISPFDNVDRPVANGIIYRTPEDKRLLPDDFKNIKNFFTEERTYKDIVDNIKGVSPLLARHIVTLAKDNHNLMYDIYLDLYNQEITPTVKVSDKRDFYYIDIFRNDKIHYDSLSKMLDNYYEDASSQERIKQIYKYLVNFVKREFKRKKNKLEKLDKDMTKARNSDVLRIKADTLMANLHTIHKGDSEFSGFAYELEKNVEIELDRLLSPVQNANKYYNKYKKQKKAIIHIDEQILITKSEIIYFDDLISQINNTGSLNDLLEIQNELIDNGFMSKRKKIESKKKPNYDIYIDDLGVRILVGKNNIQNNYLTHKYAKKDYWWFHVKNSTGSHVVVSQVGELEEITIRTAANLAAYYSKSKLSNSVAVDYTLIRNIKKVPGRLGSYVTFTNQRTIYIDPSEEMINNLKKAR